ncbi:MAG: response regulator transcription factor [bacterium]|nr:response regulator transcription factor [bacterium]MCM1376279.1 response regulator transcription factor [Muribaculum sp.]
MANILVCDDDREIVDAIDIYLREEGYGVFKAYDGQQAIELLSREQIHLLIMDVMMPNMDGIEATLKIRAGSSIPIIILSAKSEDADKILGLNVGADDYVTKPFNPLELIARVKSNLRRYTSLGSLSQENTQIYRAGGLVINDETKEVRVDEELVKLTPMEYNILLLLVKNQGRVFSINEIYENIWNEDAIGADNTVAVHIRHIREKIEINPRDPRYLKVVWGVGYKIEKQDNQANESRDLRGSE